MSDLHDARVEAACKAYQAAQNADPYDFRGRMSAALAAADAVVTVDAREHLHAKCDCVPDLGPAHCHLCSNERGAPVPWPECSAVAPVVTVEIIAEVLRRHQDFTPGDSCRCGWVATVGDSSHARHQAFKLIELLRGDEDGERNAPMQG